MNNALSPEELSDLEDQFIIDHADSIKKYEIAMTELFKAGKYQGFLDTLDQAAAVFHAFGPGGDEYFKNTWLRDPRVNRAQNAILVRQKFPDGPSVDSVCLEIVTYIQGKGRVFASEIFKMFPTLPHDLISKALSKMCKEKKIVKGYDKSGYKIYTLS